MTAEVADKAVPVRSTDLRERITEYVSLMEKSSLGSHALDTDHSVREVYIAGGKHECSMRAMDLRVILSETEARPSAERVEEIVDATAIRIFERSGYKWEVDASFYRKDLMRDQVRPYVEIILDLLYEPEA